MRQEFFGAAHLLVGLRVVHPVLAVAAVFYLLFAASSAMRLQDPGQARKIALLAALLVFLQLAAGAVNVTLLAPVWMQILHLLIADLLWIAFAVLVLEAAACAHDRPHRSVA
jgi:heme A synthase